MKSHSQTPTLEINNQFLKDVIAGLTHTPKFLQSKYFYDTTGDALFQQIMALPEYYLTRCELDIFQNKTVQIADAIDLGGTPFDLIELGAGDATKSLYLLEYLASNKVEFVYMPIDISGNILSILNKKVASKLPNLKVLCLEGDYFEMLNRATKISSRRKILLFLGSNIGNMELEQAYDFCRNLRKTLNKGDLVLMGFDLKKHPKTILSAYNDASGITSRFNLNLLQRINKELCANFDVEEFEHYQNYDPLTGACKSYLISLKDQKITVDSTVITFQKNEIIYMEISQKFSLADIGSLASKTGFTPTKFIMDDKGWFVDSCWLAN